MDRTLKELEREFRAGVVSRRDFFRRAALIVAGGAAAFELLGRLSPHRLAWASPGITLDPTVNPLAQGYETDGTADYATSSRLVINDASADTHPPFFQTATQHSFLPPPLVVRQYSIMQQGGGSWTGL